jgi:branched-chain amino acid aminotransferase
VEIVNKGKSNDLVSPLDPNSIDFGQSFTNNFFVMEYSDGAWHNPRIQPLTNFSLHPASIVLHYGQQIFEGMKAHRKSDGGLALFRPHMNAKRLNRSARRLNMPEIDVDFFLKALKSLVINEQAHTPDRPGSLYLRPTMIATQPCIRVAVSQTYLFYILALPAGPYFKGSAEEAGKVDVLVTRDVVRAAPLGTGNIKSGINYAGTLQIASRAKALGCQQVLYLDGKEQKYIEEAGAMNIFFVDDGKIITPKLSGAILPGVTRDSILQLARDRGLQTEECSIPLDYVLENIESGRISEVFCCGTAVRVTGLNSFVFEDNTRITVTPTPGPVTKALFSDLTQIQYGMADDRHDWLYLT